MRATVENLISKLPTMCDRHAPGSSDYESLRESTKALMRELFSDPSDTAKPFGPFGELIFPYYKMGAIDSVDLFGLDEIVLFSFYWVNRHRYRRVLDIGANIGLHSIIMARCGFSVRSFEPDPMIFARLNRNLVLNSITTVATKNTAISDRPGAKEFTRVLGNLTGSHLSGAKETVYGEVERFSVSVESIVEHAKWADFAKIDAEGHEAEILLGVPSDCWKTLDSMVEIGNEKSAVRIFDGFAADRGVRLFCQKNSWRRVTKLEDMPTNYRDGSLFITSKDHVPFHPNPS